MYLKSKQVKKNGSQIFIGFPVCITSHMTSIGGLHARARSAPEGSGGGSASRGSASRGVYIGGGGGQISPGTRKPESMHPTGMLSCLICYLFL